ncbi:MAG: PVC-type heme-binding CxxCH protein, partial [Planctomycetaceae bacterium]
VDMLYGAEDKWFRPSDVCVAPDGSLIVADWYDPGVGGHRMGDIEKGRLFRIAPPEAAAKYETPNYDFDSVAGAIAALKSPNLAARYLAWTALHKRGKKAEDALLQVFEKDENPRFRARALWLLGKIDGRGRHYVERAIEDENADIRIVGIRLARQLKLDLIPILTLMAVDQSPQVRREVAIALRHHASPEAPAIWAELARRHDGDDRWYLEALGIGADGQWDDFFGTWLQRVGEEWDTPAGRDIVWRSRSEAALPLLAKIILDERLKPEERLRYFRAFDFHQHPPDEGGELKESVLLNLATAEHPAQPQIAELALKHLGRADINESAELKSAVSRALDDLQGTPQFVELVEQFHVVGRAPELLAIAQQHANEQLGVEAIRALLSMKQTDLLRGTITGTDEEAAMRTIQALGNSADGQILGLLRPLLEYAKTSPQVRREAVRALAKVRGGAMELVKRSRAGSLDPSLTEAAAAALHAAQWEDVRAQAETLFPRPATKNAEPLPPIAELVKRQGDAVLGRIVYNTTGTCVKCHKVNSVGHDVGPDLTEIGGKLSRQALFESIVYPSAGVSHNYETYVLVLADGNTVNGIITSRTSEELSLKGADAIVRTFKTSDVEEIVKQDIWLMPADLNKALTVEDLVNVV